MWLRQGSEAGPGGGVALCHSPQGPPRVTEAAVYPGSEEQDAVTLPTRDWAGGQGCSLSQPSCSPSTAWLPFWLLVSQFGDPQLGAVS